MSELTVLNEIMDELKEKLSHDKRTFTQREYSVENDNYYDGVFDSYKIVKKYYDEHFVSEE